MLVAISTLQTNRIERVSGHGNAYLIRNRAQRLLALRSQAGNACWAPPVFGYGRSLEGYRINQPSLAAVSQTRISPPNLVRSYCLCMESVAPPSGRLPEASLQKCL